MTEKPDIAEAIAQLHIAAAAEAEAGTALSDARNNASLKQQATTDALDNLADAMMTVLERDHLRRFLQRFRTHEVVRSWILQAAKETQRANGSGD